MPKTKIKMSFTFPANLEFLPEIRNLVMIFCKKIQTINNQWCHRIESITDELCTNAIEHGSQKNKEVKLQISYKEPVLEIIAEDTGTGKKTKTKKELAKIRGRGLKIVKSWTDNFHFSKTPKGGIRAKAKIKL